MTDTMRFGATIRHDDFVVADHRVHGVRIMPGVAFLDMVWRILRAKGHDPTQAEIVDVLFAEAVAVADRESRRIIVAVDADAECWSVVARSQRLDHDREAGGELSENFRCRVRLLGAPTGDVMVRVGDAADGRPTTLVGMDAVYARARAVEIDHRPRMRLVGDIRKTETTAEARLALTSEAATFEPDYIVHPAVLDSATLVPFVFRHASEIDKPYIPLSIDRVTLGGPVRGAVLVQVRHDPVNGGAHDVLFHDYDLCAPDGRVLVRVERLCAKRVRGRLKTEAAAAAQECVTPCGTSSSSAVSRPPVRIGPAETPATTLRSWLCEYVGSVLGREVGWDESEVGFYDLGLDSRQLLAAVGVLERGLGSTLYPTLLFEQGTMARLAEYLLAEQRAGVARLLASGTGSSADLVAAVPADTGEPAQTLFVAPVWSARELAGGASSGALLVGGAGHGVEAAAARWAGGLTAQIGAAGAVLFGWRGDADVAGVMELAGAVAADAALVVAHAGGAEGSGVAGLLASVSRERPSLRLVSVAGADADALMSELSGARRGFTAVRHHDGRREELGFGELVLRPAALPSGGTWVITGGLGGLGLIFARALVGSGARVGLIGRRAPDEQLAAELAGLGIAWALGDVSDRGSLSGALDKLRDRLGAFTGVIHAAGVLRDALVSGGIDAASVAAVLAPKVMGAANLDALTRHDPLEAFVVFSSVSGSFGNVGQAAYAYANGWLNGFAAERPGRTLSLGWPLWADGGMGVAGPELAELRERHGVVALPSAAGMAAFAAALNSAPAHLAVLHGEADRLRQSFGLAGALAVACPAVATPEIGMPAVLHPRPEHEPIAVIGLAGRYPGARDLAEFWRNLAAGVDSVTEVPASRWDHRAYFDASGEQAGTSWSRWGGFIEGVDQFDPLFFHISPREARVMDPQERLFLETSFAALEDAGLSRAAIAGGRVGVFAGVMWSQYQLYGLAAAQEGSGLLPMSFNASVANRVSHVLDLRGPSLSLDTACSSSLTALHLAIESLRRRECDAAFAGGVNLTLHPSKYQFLGQGRMLSRDGRCRAFGAGGDGYVPGEGVGVALLKRLSDAVGDGDPIWGVLLGSGISHGGRTAGYTVPSASRQAELIERVLADAQVSAAEVSYIEAHGTGTALGDPIEVAGLKGAYGASSPQPWCSLGSVKSNIGHLESAAGIAGLTKVLLQLRHGQIAPSLHVAELNAGLEIAGTPFRVQDALAPWRNDAGRRVAGLSSFGAGGANAHIIIAEPPPRPTLASSTAPEIIVLSARTPAALTQRAKDLIAWIDQTATPTAAIPAPAQAVAAMLAAAAAEVLAVEPSALDTEEDWDGLGLAGNRLDALRVGIETRLGRPVPALLLTTHRSIARLAAGLADRREPEPRFDVAALAHTLQVGRTPFVHRLAFIAGEPAQVRAGLATHVAGNTPALEGPIPLRAAAQQFLASEDLDWAAMRAKPHPPRVGSLPTYPFEHRGFWITAAPFTGAAQPPLPSKRIVTAAETEAVATAPILPHDIVFIPRWRRDQRVGSRAAHDGELWIVAAPERGTCAQALTQARPAARLMSWDDATKQLLSGLVPDDMCLLPGGANPLVAMLELTKALAQPARRTSVRLKLVTSGAHAVLPGELPDAAQSSLGAFLRSALPDLPGVESVFVDLGAGDDPAVILDEACASRPADVAWRNGARFCRRLHPLDLPGTEHGIRRGGRYLVTGGAGRVGVALAAELSRRFGARIALVGRRAPHSGIAAVLASIRGGGGEAVYISADIAETRGAQQAVAQTLAMLGGLDGVIHAAAVYDERPLDALTQADLQAALYPKLDGWRALADALRHVPLDAFVLFSSAQIYAGNSGRAHYAAACAAADAAAARLAADAPWPVRIINWGFWDAGEIATPGPRAQLAVQGATPLSAAEGVEVLARALVSPAVQIASLRLDTGVRPFLGIDDSERFAAVGAHEASVFATVQALTAAPDADGRLATCRVGFEAVNRHALARFFELLRAHGLFGASGELHDRRHICDALGVAPRFCRFLDAALVHLVDAGLLDRSGADGFTLALPSPSWAAPDVAHSAMAANLRLLDACFEALPDILSGRIPPTDIMFPGGTSELVEGVYRGNPASDWFNGQTGAAIAAVAEARLASGRRRLRVLEIGAGSGGTTEAVLGALDGFAGRVQVEYVFTDVSTGFLRQGRRFGAARPWLDFRILDIEADPSGQGFSRGAFNVVLAANVLHATRLIGRSLGHVLGLLCPGGILVLNEAVAIEPFTTFTFGLLDGWWAAEDETLRLPHGPLLSPSGWVAAMADAGFVRARALPAPQSTPALDAMRVIVAESGGIAPVAQALPAAIPTGSLPYRAIGASFGRSDNLERRAQLERRVIAEIAAALELDAGDVGPDVPFAELGVDSILAVAAVHRLNAAIGIALRTTDLFNYADVRRLVAHIAEAFPNCGPELPQPIPEAPVATIPAAPKSVLRDDIGLLRGRSPSRDEMPVAVIGMSGRFPDADNPDEYWRNLERGHDAVREIPAARWPLAGFYDPDPNVGASTGKWGGFLSGIDGFDPAYFQMSPREAELTDPQHRLFLMEAVRALEDGGLTRARLAGSRLGIFVGCKAGDYFRNLGDDDRTAHAFTGNAGAILPARLAYHLDTKGPAIAVDTACSSALVALHLAIQSMQAGDCDMAVAGAVALMATPHTHLTLSRAGMLSPTGRCRAFDQGADGFVPGEGVGVVVLKRLDLALADGDPIHGVIRASAINQDGRSSGITAPSAPSQTRLIAELYAKSHIDPASIGYLEAHGTGTKLGDPIEAAALADAFTERVPKGWNCPLGSVKSTIGHTMEAAGMAGLIKVLLMLRHRRLAPSLHFAEPNHHIDFAALPFEVLTQASDWPAPSGNAPRRAAVSAFGFSGTNAHVVVEEAPRRDVGAIAPRPSFAFFVSARGESSLKRRCGELADWLAHNPGTDLAAVSATLLLGRDHHGYRAAVCGATNAAVIEALRGLAEGRSGPQALIGTAGARPEPALAELGKLLIERIGDPRLAGNDYRDKLLALADLYVRGYPLAFEMLFAAGRPLFVSLPTYPFDDRRCWIAPANVAPALRATNGADLLGTIDQAASLGEGLVFRSAIASDHWLFADHQVRGRKLMPATASLALAVAAGERIWGTGSVVVEGMRWRRPVDGTLGAQIVTTVRRDGAATIATAAGVHMECRIVRSGPSDQPVIDLAAVRGRMTHVIEGGEFYGRCAHAGFAFGQRFRRLRDVAGNGGEALGRVDAHVDTPATGIDAGFLDAVLQTVGGRVPGTTLAGGRTVMPATLDRMEVLGPLPRSAQVVARMSQDGRFDLDVADQDGNVALRLSGLAFVTLAAELSAETGAEDAEEVDVYVPRWKVAEAAAAAPSGKVVILGGEGAPDLVAALRRSCPLAEILPADGDPGGARHIYYLGALDGVARGGALTMAEVADCETRAVLPLLRLIKRIAGERVTLKVVTDRVHALSAHQDIRPFGAAALGLAKAAAREILPLAISAIDIDLADDAGEIADRLVREPAHGHGEDIAIRRGVRFRRMLSRAEIAPASPPFRRGGTYLIIGGAGGIGAELSVYLASRHAARLVWIGRRPEDDHVRAAMRRVEAAGGEVAYLAADVADLAELRAAIAAARARFGAVHGVVHSALVLRDMLIANMGENDLLEVLAPKTRGIAALAEALKDEPLDFFCVFSSAIAFSGNPGQSSYAAASLFIDAFAGQMRRLLPYPVTVVDWGYWGEVGIVADAPTRRRMHAQGVLSIAHDTGMDVFGRIMAAGIAQAMPIRLASHKRGEMADPSVIERRTGKAAPAVMPFAEFPADADDSEGVADFFAELDRYGRARVAGMLRPALPAAGTKGLISQVRRRLDLSPERESLLVALLDMLARDGSAIVAGEEIEALRVPDRVPPPGDPRARHYLPLLEACLDGLPDILAGRRDAAAILFPAGSRHLVEQVYAGNVTMAACDATLAALAADFVRQRRALAADEALHILEIGAGTGAASRRIAAALAPLVPRIDYIFTDVSRSFIARAEAALGGDFPFIRFATLDIGTAPSAQGFEVGAFDLVIASNVLHAVGDIAAALGHAKSLLRPGGLLLINEVTRVRDFITLTFGLTPEWWKHGDQDGRLPHAPLLSGLRWCDRLAAAGFSRVETFGPPRGGRNGERPQVIFAAVSDGWAPCAVEVAPAAAAEPAAGAAVAAGSEGLALDFVRRVFARVLRTAEAELDADATFETFGVDSLLVIDINRAFETELGTIPATILYEARTLRALAQRLAGAISARASDQAERSIAPVTISGAANVSSTEPQEPISAGRELGEDEPIAVIGMACRFPGAPDADAFWSLLRDGRSAIEEIPAARWDWRSMPAGARGERGRHYSRWGGFIADADKFDPLFFGISPQEAESLDPQERLFLQTAWHVLEDAGYPAPALKGAPVGVFVGAMNAGYEWLSGRAAAHGHAGDAHSAYWSIANRVSYQFDLRGPSMAVDTACSSSLTALHLACESLRRGECTAAIAGGVNVIAGPVHYARLCGLGMLSEGPQCRSFGADADGFVDGEGVGAVLLKPLSRALADGDFIHGVIRASALNSGGKTGGYTVPNPAAQAAVVAGALARARLAADELSYVEAHGTGTSLGDPIELAALNDAFRRTTDATAFCALGSVKSNIGHLESAAGMAGLIKVLLMMRHRTLVPTLHVDPPNPKLALAGSPFRLQRDTQPWEVRGSRRAGVSSFGAGGANVHVIVEDAPPLPAAAEIAGPHLVVLSADDRDQLAAQVRALLGRLGGKLGGGADSLISLVAEVLGVAAAEIDPALPLHDIGLDGAAAARLVGLARERLGVDLRVDPQTSITLLAQQSDLRVDESPPLAAIALTLQTGRAQLADRFAALVDDVPMLAQALETFLRHDLVPPLKGAGEWSQAGRRFLVGEAVDFRAMWPKPRPSRLMLPPYAFRRERYWIPELDHKAAPGATGPGSAATADTAITAAAVLRFPIRSKGARVAVIGGGPAGLVATKSLREAGHDPVLFEQTDRTGGIWAVRPHRPRGAYRSVRLQSSKYTALFSDFPAPEEMAIFPGVDELDAYFQSYAASFDLAGAFRLSTTVRDVRPDGGGWRVRYAAAGTEDEEAFDAVALCPGLFSVPTIPDIPGRGSFRGRVLHSTAYAEPSAFAGQRVLVVGNGVSGMDIAAEISDVARSTCLAVRTRQWVIPRMIGFVPNDCSLSPLRRMLMRTQSTQEIVAGWRDAMPSFMSAYERSRLMPDGPIEGLLNVNDRLIELVDIGRVGVKPEVQAFQGDTVAFSDGSREEYDAVIFCTGFRLPRVPFLGCDPADLYGNHFHPDHPTLAVIGMYPTTLGCFSTIELGARWFAAVLSGQVPRADRVTMDRKIAADRARALARDGAAVVPIDTAVDNIWLAEQIGAFPDPAVEWRLYWELLNSPPIPSIYRLCGPHAWNAARAHFDNVKSKLFVKADDSDSSLVADAMLAELGPTTVRDLAARREIGDAQRDRVLGMLPVAVKGGSR